MTKAIVSCKAMLQLLSTKAQIKLNEQYLKTIQSGQKKLQKRFQTPQRLQVPRNYIQTLLNTTKCGNQANKNKNTVRNNHMTLNQELDSFSLYNNTAYNPTPELNRTQQSRLGDHSNITNNYMPTYGSQPNQINNQGQFMVREMHKNLIIYSQQYDVKKNKKQVVRNSKQENGTLKRKKFFETSQMKEAEKRFHQKKDHYISQTLINQGNDIGRRMEYLNGVNQGYSKSSNSISEGEEEISKSQFEKCMKSQISIKLIFMTPGQAPSYQTAEDLYCATDAMPKAVTKGALSKNGSKQEDTSYVEYNTAPPIAQNITRNVSNFKVQTQIYANPKTLNTNLSGRSTSISKRGNSNFRSSRQGIKKGGQSTLAQNQTYQNIHIKNQNRREITPNPQKKQTFGLIVQNINQSQVGVPKQAKPNKVMNISNVHTITKEFADINQEVLKQQSTKPGKQINNIFKKKDIPLIIDDRSSYYDSDREKDFYLPATNTAETKDQLMAKSNNQDDDDENIDQQNILWNEFGNEEYQPSHIIESRLDNIEGDNSYLQAQNSELDNLQSQKDKSFDPKTYLNSQYKLQITESNDDYTLENKIKQDTLPIIQKSNNLKKNKQQRELKQQTKQMRSMKQSNHLLQLVSNQDLDQMKDFIHKSIQQRRMLVPADGNQLKVMRASKDRGSTIQKQDYCMHDLK